jgi:hypothetical protein
MMSFKKKINAEIGQKGAFLKGLKLKGLFEEVTP